MTDWELLRHKFVRDPTNECEFFLTELSEDCMPGSLMQDWATDGHYLCAECLRRKPEKEWAE